MAEALAAAGVTFDPSASSIPKGGVAALRRAQRKVRQPVIEVDRPVTHEPLVWREVGRALSAPRYLELHEVKAIHFALVEVFAETSDPISPAGVRDEHLLASALTRQYTGGGGLSKYPTVELAAGALLHSLVHNHPFHNGNKRTALVSMLVFLDENGYVLDCDQQALYQFVLKVARHALVPNGIDQKDDREVLVIAQWLRANARPLEFENRILKWRQLRSILARFDCTVEIAHNRGNRITVERTVTEKRLFGRPRHRHVAWQYKYVDEGTDVPKATVADIRSRFGLDEAHGVDSAVFYGKKPIDEVINDYRKILNLLARL